VTSLRRHAVRIRATTAGAHVVALNERPEDLLEREDRILPPERSARAVTAACRAPDRGPPCSRRTPTHDLQACRHPLDGELLRVAGDDRAGATSASLHAARICAIEFRPRSAAEIWDKP